MKRITKIFLCLVVASTIFNCSSNENHKDLESCNSFFEERFFQLSVGYRKFSQRHIFSIDLNSLLKESKDHLDSKNYTEINNLLEVYLDSVQIVYQTSNSELNMLVQKTKKLRHGSCNYYYSLIQTFEAFYKETSSVEGLYMPETTIKLFVGNNFTLKRDTVYKFEYGLVSNTYPDHINNVYFDTNILEVTTYGDTAEIQKSLKFDLINNFTNEKRTYSEDFTFKIED